MDKTGMDFPRLAYKWFENTKEGKAIMLPLISFRSEVPGLISVNDRPLGKISEKKTVALPALDKATIFVRFMPLCNDKEELYAQLSFALDFREGKLKPVGSPYVHVSIWDDRLFVFALHPPKLAAHSLPYTVCCKEIGHYLASILYQNDYYLIIEHKKNEQPDFFSPLPFQGENVSLESAVINDNQVLLAGDHQSHLYAFTQSGPEFTQVLAMPASDWMTGQDSLAITQVLTTVPHRIIRYYTFSQGKPSLKETKYDLQKNQAQDEKSACLEFLECAYHGIAARCETLMTAELASGLSFADLKDFLGEFSTYYPSPYGKNIYALEYPETGGNHQIKQFTFEMNESKIDNIEELS